MTRTLLLVSAAALALLPLSGAGQAGCRPIVSHHQQQLVVGYVPTYQPQTYYVGQNLQVAAMEDRIAAAVVAKLQAQQLQAPPAPAAPQTLPLTAEVDRWALVKANCAGCHAANEKAMAAFDLSGDLETLTCEDRLAAIRELVSGTMPKGKKISPEALGDLIGVFSGSDQVGK